MNKYAADGTVKVIDTGPATDDNYVVVEGSVVTTFDEAEELCEAVRRTLRQMNEVRRYKNQETRMNPQTYGLLWGDKVRIGKGHIVWELAGIQPSWKHPGDVEAILHTRDAEGTINRTRRCRPSDLVKEITGGNGRHLADDRADTA